tara:strand:+ start:186 stop:704 length:519 start_codon:yes stop_codon:yes gene_type:complete
LKKNIKISVVFLIVFIFSLICVVAYRVSIMTPEELAVCMLDKNAYRIPSSYCEFSLLNLRDSQKDALLLDEHVGLGFIMDEDNIEVSKMLLNHFIANGANVNQPNPIHGLPPLFAAILSNSPEFCRYMIEHGADTNSVDLIYQKTPRELVQFLKEKEPEVDRSEIEKCLSGF